MNSVVSPIDQAVEFVRESQRPLIIVHQAKTLDVLAAGQALGRALSSEKPGIALVILPAHQPGNRDVVGSLMVATEHLPSVRDFVISVDTSNTQVDSLSYDLQPGRLNIRLTPKSGTFQPTDVAMPPSSFFFDHIITINLGQLEDIGPDFQLQRDFFYHTPILNIDTGADNRRFGHVNLVDLTASSVSEVIAELLRRLHPESMETAVAQTLLTGIIAATNGFQSDRVNPRTLMAASHLMTAGAKREEIIRRLYQTKTVQQLRLWGRTLSSLQTADHDQLIWATILETELRQHELSADQASGLAHELFASAPSAIYACLLVETPPTVTVTIVQRLDAPPPIVPDGFTSSQPHRLDGILVGSLAAVEKQIIGSLRTSLGK